MAARTNKARVKQLKRGIKLEFTGKKLSATGLLGYKMQQTGRAMQRASVAGHKTKKKKK